MEKENKRVHQKLNADELYFSLKEKDEKEKIANHLINPEYACDCQGKYCDGFPVRINAKLAEMIETLRGLINHQILIVSGVRCKEQNLNCDGSKYSFHQLGRAADIKCENLSVDALAIAAEAVGLLVIRDYKEGMVHCQWNN
ncbi:MAG: D-Ala-D-Ala carboxypeptidase family metallohydrolase [Acetobacterium sp.]